MVMTTRGMHRTQMSPQRRPLFLRALLRPTHCRLILLRGLAWHPHGHDGLSTAAGTSSARFWKLLLLLLLQAVGSLLLFPRRQPAALGTIRRVRFSAFRLA